MISRKVFPKRPLRLDPLFQRYAQPVYFVTFCTYQRYAFLASTAVQNGFIAFATCAAREHNIAVGRYVLMPDHVHLFVRGGPEFDLGRWIGLLKRVLAKDAGRVKSTGRIWQEGFFDHVLRNDASYDQKWEYVRQNLVRAGLVAKAEHWPYQGEIVPIDRTE